MTTCYGVCLLGYGASMTLTEIGSVAAALLVIGAAALAAAALFARSCGARPR